MSLNFSRFGHSIRVFCARAVCNGHPARRHGGLKSRRLTLKRGTPPDALAASQVGTAGRASVWRVRSPPDDTRPSAPAGRSELAAFDEKQLSSKPQTVASPPLIRVSLAGARGPSTPSFNHLVSAMKKAPDGMARLDAGGGPDRMDSLLKV